MVVLLLVDKVNHPCGVGVQLFPEFRQQKELQKLQAVWKGEKACIRGCSQVLQVFQVREELFVVKVPLLKQN